jgi:hypothetical protein
LPRITRSIASALGGRRVQCFLLLVPQPFGHAFDAGGQVTAIGTEREPEPFGCGLLLRRRFEIGQFQDAPQTPVVGEYRLGCIGQHLLQSSDTHGFRSVPCHDVCVQQRIADQLIRSAVMTQCVSDRRVEIRPCQHDNCPRLSLETKSNTKSC